MNEMENHAQQFGDPGKVGSMRTLQFKPHFSAQILSSEEVALLGEGGRYALRGKVYAALVPCSTGPAMTTNSWRYCETASRQNSSTMP